MSRENIEIVRAAHEAWNTGDRERLRELHDPDVIARSLEGWPEPGPFVGREAVMRQFDQLQDTWEINKVDPVGAFIDVADRVVVRVIWRGVGRGPDSNMEMTSVFTLRDGKIFAIEYFWDHAKALEAVGLSN